MLQPLLENGRRLYAAQAWTEALSAFESADGSVPLSGPDLTRSAFSAFLLGHEQQCIDLLGRAFLAHLEAQDPSAAARTAFWLAFAHETHGDRARAESWGRRLAGLVEEEGLDAERGLLCAGLSHAALASHDPTDIRRALDLSREAFALAHAARDRDTEVLSRLSGGWALLRLGSRTDALAELDQAMDNVTSGEVQTPIVNGVAYCSLISASLHAADVARAREWTTAATEWCARNPDLVPFRGQCLVHRSVVKMLDGDWAGALAEAMRASARLLPADAGIASYQIGELCRLTGRFAEAEDAYRLANSAGRRPEPGLMLLRLSQGRTALAAVSARRLNAELTGPGEREEFLPGYVEVMAADGDAESALAGAAEFAALTEASGAALLRARALATRGTACSAAGDPFGAAASFRSASLAWHDLGMPYPEARARGDLGRCYAALGDDEAAALEIEAARNAFERLGAGPDLDALPGPTPWPSTPLTGRELDVIRLVATGLTNRAMAGKLVLSERTVARHLANIYAKLGIASRSAATAYAYDHGLL